MIRSFIARVEKLEACRPSSDGPRVIVMKVQGYVETPEDRAFIERKIGEGQRIILLNRLGAGSTG